MCNVLKIASRPGLAVTICAASPEMWNVITLDWERDKLSGTKELAVINSV